MHELEYPRKEEVYSRGCPLQTGRQPLFYDVPAMQYPGYLDCEVYRRRCFGSSLESGVGGGRVMWIVLGKSEKGGKSTKDCASTRR